MKKMKPDFSSMSKKQIIEYVWYYYKWYFVSFIMIIGILSEVVYTSVTAKEFVLRGIFINSAGEDAGEEIEQSFREYSAINTEKEDIFFDTNYYFSNEKKSSYAIESYETLQIMNAKIVVGEIDFMVGDLKIMNDMAYQQYFLELSGIMKEDVLRKLKPYLLYYDKAFLQELGSINTSEKSEGLINYPDPRNPELMHEPIPIFVDVSSCEKLQNLYPYKTNECVIALTINGSNAGRVLEFIEFLME